MKIADIVTQLATILPLLSSRYTSSVNISTISGDGVTATAETESVHGLIVGSPVFITNVAIDTAITTVTLTANLATIETATDHDLTFGWPPHETVTLSGFTDSNWNDSFTLLSVPNRRKFTIDATGLVDPNPLNGSEILEELVTGGFNGPQQVVTVPTTTNFTFASTFSTNASGGQVVTQIRIAGAATRGRAEEEYTKQNPNDLWLFVVQPDTVRISKDRNAEGDAESEQGPTTSFELDLLDGFTILCFVPSADSKAGLGPSDTARDLVLRDLLLSIQRFKPASGLANDTPFRVVLSNHGPAMYNGAIYVHQFVFQIPLRMTIDDTIDIVNTVAFRDVDLTINNPDSAAVLTAMIDLDEQPIS